MTAHSYETMTVNSTKFGEPVKIAQWLRQWLCAVAAKYWGRDSAKLEDFTVPSNCSGLNLPKAGSLNIYSGPSEQGCKVGASLPITSLSITIPSSPLALLSQESQPN